MSALPAYAHHNAAELHFTISHLSIGVAVLSPMPLSAPYQSRNSGTVLSSFLLFRSFHASPFPFHRPPSRSAPIVTEPAPSRRRQASLPRRHCRPRSRPCPGIFLPL